MIDSVSVDLLYMHRGFFARAISDHPKDPLGSPYGGSFIAAYRSAGSLVALVRNIHSQLKELTEREKQYVERHHNRLRQHRLFDCTEDAKNKIKMLRHQMDELEENYEAKK